MVIAFTAVRKSNKKQLCDDLQASLSFHPNVLLEGQLLYDSQNSSLKSLEEIVSRYGALTEEHAIEVITRVAHVLSNLHRFQLVIGDSLAPQNIFLNQPGIVKLRIPTEVFEAGMKDSRNEVSDVSMLSVNRIRETEQQAVHRDIRLLGALFCFALFGEDATPRQKLELRQLETTWDHESKSLPEGKPVALQPLIWRMIRAGYAEGYCDMHTVVIDLWELGIVSFSHK